ncbi:MFS transporter [Mesorhizobium sp.]
MLLEGASIDWSAIYMRTVFDSGPFVAGLTVALFAFSQATTRFFADSFVDRHSPSGVARVLLAAMAAGVLIVFFSPLPAVSMLGFALLGIGSSALFPLAISAAAQRTDPRRRSTSRRSHRFPSSLSCSARRCSASYRTIGASAPPMASASPSSRSAC